MRHEQRIRGEGLVAEIELIGSVVLMVFSLAFVLWQALESVR